jgi:hypothetical protein
MHRRALITNLKFVYADQKRELRGKLRYFQFRNDKTSASHVRQLDEFGQRVERWVDRGLGDEHHAIVAGCQAQATDNLKRNVSARLLVIAPEVHFMAAIAEDRRLAVLHELTEATVENWFEQMDLPTPDFAYVVHEAQPSDLRPDGRPKDEPRLSDTYLHTHVVLAPTVADLEEAKLTYKVFEPQLRTLHEVGREAMQQIWERELGTERVAELNQELEERTQRYLELDMAQEGRDTPEIALPEPTRAVPPPTLDLDLELEFGE